jgi:hypothetical protein
MKTPSLAVLLIAASAATAADGIYKSVGPDGRTVFSDQPPAGAKPAAVPPAAPAKADPKALEKAVLGVLGLEDLVRQTERLCLEAKPESASRYSGAASGWRERNARYVARALRALNDEFGAAERALITLGLAGRNAQVLGAVKQAAVERRVQWCEESVTEIRSRRMDVTGKAALTGPLAKD